MSSSGTTVSPPLKRQGFLVGLLKGLRGYALVPATLTRLRLWHSLLWPGLVSLICSLLFLIGIWFLGRWITDYVENSLSISPPWLDHLIALTIGVFTALLLVVLFVLGHKHLVLVALAPVLGKLAESVQRGIDTGPRPGQSLGLMGSLLRSAAVNSRSILLELTLTAFCMIFLLIPGIGSLVTAILVFLIQARFMGQGLFDFPLEYRSYTVSESAAFSRAHRGLATGLGSGYLLIMLIPVVGWMFAAPFGTVAGVLEAHRALMPGKAASPQGGGLT
ncbi:MAG TPA: EI24 domain-containing protein [Verrucomicrobiales bacterium]|nr:EI24 domain-containing protein [Verrucomicrobiae bacterium]MCP5553496.1 EI24 domain-containing protein [Akkermansiaceae bacterium]HRX55874.1 EI24 domain-containing protein [Verrucomicrobiales bacterium]